MKYLDLTKELELTLEAEKGNIILCKWYPDAAFAVHRDMKSHTGAVFSLGKGAVTTISAKQKLNTRSSTEAELVGADDIVGQAMWTRSAGIQKQDHNLPRQHQHNVVRKNGTES
jgi:hypothetical protein